MNKCESINKPLMWSMTILMAAIMAGCGGGGGGGGVIPGVTPGTQGAPVSIGAGSAGDPATTGGGCTGASCVNLGAAANYVILAKTGVSTVPSSVVTGNVGVSPAARGYLTGWSLIGEPTDTYYTSAQVVAPGKLFAADMVGGTTTSDLGTAVLDMGAAYTAAAGMATSGGGLPAGGPKECPGVGAMSDVNDALPGGGSFSAAGLPAGVYTCTVDITIPGTLTLNGNATDVWVFKTTGTLTPATGVNVVMGGTALAKNVFWQVAGAVTITTNAHMQGVILAQTNIAVQTGATVTGRLLAQTAITLQNNTVTVP